MVALSTVGSHHELPFKSNLNVEFGVSHRPCYIRAVMKMRIAVWLLAVLLVNPTGSATAQEKVHVAISNFSASYISMHIAQKRGFYAEEGMIVEIILMAGLTSTRALIGNSVELGSASNPTAAVQGAKLKILLVFNDKPPGHAGRAARHQERYGAARQTNRRVDRRQLGIRLAERTFTKVWTSA